MSQFENDKLIFEEFENDEILFEEAIGDGGLDKGLILQAIKIARDMQKAGAEMAYNTTAMMLGKKIIDQAMAYGESIVIKKEHHVINKEDVAA